MKIQFTVDEVNPVHTRIKVFSGNNIGYLGFAGNLCFTNEEWRVLKRDLMECPNIIIKYSESSMEQLKQLKNNGGDKYDGL